MLEEFRQYIPESIRASKGYLMAGRTYYSPRSLYLHPLQSLRSEWLQPEPETIELDASIGLIECETQPGVYFTVVGRKKLSVLRKRGGYAGWSPGATVERMERWYSIILLEGKTFLFNITNNNRVLNNEDEQLTLLDI